MRRRARQAHRRQCTSGRPRSLVEQRRASAGDRAPIADAGRAARRRRAARAGCRARAAGNTSTAGGRTAPAPVERRPGRSARRGRATSARRRRAARPAEHDDQRLQRSAAPFAAAVEPAALRGRLDQAPDQIGDLHPRSPYELLVTGVDRRERRDDRRRFGGAARSARRPAAARCPRRRCCPSASAAVAASRRSVEQRREPFCAIAVADADERFDRGEGEEKVAGRGNLRERSDGLGARRFCRALRWRGIGRWRPRRPARRSARGGSGRALRAERQRRLDSQVGIRFGAAARSARRSTSTPASVSNCSALLRRLKLRVAFPQRRHNARRARRPRLADRHSVSTPRGRQPPVRASSPRLESLDGVPGGPFRALQVAAPARAFTLEPCGHVLDRHDARRRRRPLSRSRARRRRRAAACDRIPSTARRGAHGIRYWWSAGASTPESRSQDLEDRGARGGRPCPPFGERAAERVDFGEAVRRRQPASSCDAQLRSVVGSQLRTIRPVLS